MGFLKRFPLNTLVTNNNVSHLIETGYGIGNSCRAALVAGFEEAMSCEIYQPLYEKYLQGNHGNITVSPVDSLTFLESTSVGETLNNHRSLIFLDAHYPGSDYGKEEYNSDKWERNVQLPLISELRSLKGKIDNAAVIIDDCRIYLKDFKVVSGSMPDHAVHEFDRENEFRTLLNSFSDTHSLHWYAEDTGYALLWPHTFTGEAIKPLILPGDVTSKFMINRGVVGTTSMSINRRLMDARFSSRWLIGNGLDIGGGPDSIGIYKSLFPLMGKVTVYDMPQGDAQYLDNVGDNSFDFVYSAHCLEHVVDPMVAINNWMRVLKPNGHLIITVPDEDMYEQGVWPSTYNNDHKHTFTILKANSWSPVSINILNLIQNITFNHAVQKIELLNHSYLAGLPRFDQTRTPFAESGVEIVIKKME
uniref:methyltransferase domain-containing protein n=1 Tax=Scandinavium goeteborgense TaxID=1851514 RepID=UPI001356A699|nr:class I SAM-dependent methyltransferase [Scandinavium goeteborgense]